MRTCAKFIQNHAFPAHCRQSPCNGRLTYRCNVAVMLSFGLARMSCALILEILLMMRITLPVLDPLSRCTQQLPLGRPAKRRNRVVMSLNRATWNGSCLIFGIPEAAARNPSAYCAMSGASCRSVLIIHGERFMITLMDGVL